MKKLIAILATAAFVATASAHCGKCGDAGKDKEQHKCSEACKEKGKKCTDAEKEKCTEKKAEEKK